MNKTALKSQLVTPKVVRENFCFGLPLTKEDGSAMPDENIQFYIDNAYNEVERRLSVFLAPTKIVCNPEKRGIADFDLAEQPYDYNYRQYRHWGFLQLRQYPIVSVERVALVLPNDKEVVVFDPDWIKVYPKVGQISIVPYAGSPTVMAVAGAAGTAFPFLTGQFSRNFPQAIWVDYTAGVGEYREVTDPDTQETTTELFIPTDINEVIAKMAAIDVLGIAGDAILAGIASIGTSVDGLSENFSTTASATNATYGARILQLRSEVNAFFGEQTSKAGEHQANAGGARSYYKGFTMHVL